MKIILIALLYAMNSFASLDVIRENLLKEIFDNVPLDQRKSWQVKELADWMSRQNPDGSFNGVDYTSNDLPEWGALTQVAVAHNLLFSYRLPEHPNYQKPEVLEAGIKTLNFLASRNSNHINWWHQEIGFPRISYPLLIFAGDLLPKKVREYLKTMTLKGHVVDHPSKWAATGQNNVWYSTITVALGVIYDRSDWIEAAVKSVEKEFQIGQRTGLQVDQTFYQHGRVFYNMGYGLDFGTDMAKFIRRLKGSKWNLRERDLKLLTDYVLDGNLWLIHGKTQDFSAKGRYYCRKDSGASAFFLPACQILAELDVPRKEELKQCAQDVATGTYHKVGNKHFFRGDFLTHNRKNWSISVKFQSTRTLNQDTSPLGEGLKSHYLSDGLTYIHRSGDEYWNIYPIWDFLSLPGVTSVYRKSYPLVAVADHIKYPNYWPDFGFRDFAGAVSDGHFGAATMEIAKEKFSARKAWFFGDDEMVALGADINCEGCGDLRTGVNQEWSKGDLIQKGNSIHAGGVGYRIHEGNLRVTDQTQSGDWHDIAAALKSEKISGKVLNIHLSHGSKARNQRYAYSVFPATEKPEFFKLKSNATILSNTRDIQAVRFEREKLVLVIFYAAGKLIFDEGKSFISVNRPVALMLRGGKEQPKGVGPESFLTVSAPDQLVQEVGLTYVVKDIGFGSIVLKLPAGEERGKSVTERFQI